MSISKLRGWWSKLLFAARGTSDLHYPEPDQWPDWVYHDQIRLTWWIYHVTPDAELTEHPFPKIFHPLGKKCTSPSHNVRTFLRWEATATNFFWNHLINVPRQSSHGIVKVTLFRRSALELQFLLWSDTLGSGGRWFWISPSVFPELLPPWPSRLQQRFRYVWYIWQGNHSC